MPPSKHNSQHNHHRLPPLPPELYFQIFTHITSPQDLCSLSQVSTVFNRELIHPHANPLWNKLWALLANLPAQNLTWAAVKGTWRAQVAASFHIARLPTLYHNRTPTVQSHVAPTVVFVPPRYRIDGQPHHDDRVTVAPSNVDLEDLLGRAVTVIALGRAVVIGFERGLGLLRRTLPSKRITNVRGRFAKMQAAQRAAFYYDDAPLLGKLLFFAHTPVGENGVVIAVTSTDLLIRIEVEQDDLRDKRPLKWSIIDTFGTENGSVVEVSTSDDGVYAFIGFCSGRIRMVHIEKGGCRRVFTMRESPEMIVANGKWLVAANSFQPIACGVWACLDGRPMHDFTQTSVGWKEITTIAGLTTTASDDLFALWNGRNAIRILDVTTGEFSRIIHIECTFSKCPRSATEEAEHGAVSTHLGRGKMVLCADKKTAVVATSNRVFLVPLVRGSRLSPPVTQLDGAKRALLALSTDDRVLVTAESDVFGSLGSRVSGRASIASRPLLRFWDMNSGQLHGDVVVPSPVTSLSVAGDIVAAVSGAVGQVMVAFTAPQ